MPREPDQHFIATFWADMESLGLSVTGDADEACVFRGINDTLRSWISSRAPTTAATSLCYTDRDGLKSHMDRVGLELHVVDSAPYQSYYTGAGVAIIVGDAGSASVSCGLTADIPRHLVDELMLHETAHYQISPACRRKLANYGLGCNCGSQCECNVYVVMSAKEARAEELAACVLALYVGWWFAYPVDLLTTMLEYTVDLDDPSEYAHVQQQLQMFVNAGFITAFGEPIPKLRTDRPVVLIKR